MTLAGSTRWTQAPTRTCATTASHTHTAPSLDSEFAQRELVHHQTMPNLSEYVASRLGRSGGGLSAYVGFDPTAKALHIGHLMQILALFRCANAGLKPIALIGGATGLIGDPSGRSAERVLSTKETVLENSFGVQACIQNIAERGGFEVQYLNNIDWFGGMSVVDLLRDVGKHFPITTMLNRDSVQGRLQAGTGLSFTEFSYQLLQAHDFYHLNRHHKCLLQIGGSDQWGNVVGGCDYIRRRGGGEAHGLVQPLMVDKNGLKIGKSVADGTTIWLDGSMTSPFLLYQFFINAADEEVGRYLKHLTMLPIEQVSQILEEHAVAPHRRFAQKALARAITTLVHGEEALRRAEHSTQVLFEDSGAGVADLSAEDIKAAFQNVPTYDVSLMPGTTMGLSEVAVRCKACSSRGEFKRLAEGGGVYINNSRVGYKHQLSFDMFIGSEVCVMRIGKKQHYLFRLNN